MTQFCRTEPSQPCKPVKCVLNLKQVHLLPFTPRAGKACPPIDSDVKDYHYLQPRKRGRSALVHVSTGELMVGHALELPGNAAEWSLKLLLLLLSQQEKLFLLSNV